MESLDPGSQRVKKTSQHENTPQRYEGTVNI